MKVAIALAAVASVALAFGGTASRELAPPGAALTPFVWGVGTHLIGSAEGAEKLGYLHDFGATSFRDDVHWADVETARQRYAVPGAWDGFVAQAGQVRLTPLLILDYGNSIYDGGRRPTSKQGIEAFAAYAGFIATHFKNAGAIYEVWNEWEMRSTQDVREYVALLAATYRAIKRIDPAAIVIGGGFNVAAVSALQTFVTQGGLEYLDGLSIHPYVHCEHSRGAQGFMQLVIRMARISSGPRARPIYITEAGWPTHEGECGVSEELAAEQLARAYLIARCLPRVAGLWWYDLKNDGRDRREREQNFGLLSADWKPKAAAAVARRIGAWNGRLTCERTISSAPEQAKYRLEDSVTDTAPALTPSGIAERVRGGAAVLGYDEMVERLLGRGAGQAR